MRHGNFVLIYSPHKAKHMIATPSARYALETYKEIAGNIVTKHVQTFSAQPMPEKNETAKDFILVFNNQVKMINEELSVQADKVLAQIPVNAETEHGKLKELLFL